MITDDVLDERKVKPGWTPRAVLDLLAKADRPLSSIEIADRLGIPMDPRPRANLQLVLRRLRLMKLLEMTDIERQSKNGARRLWRKTCRIIT